MTSPTQIDKTVQLTLYNNIGVAMCGSNLKRNHLGQISEVFQTPPIVLINTAGAAEMMSTFETNTWTLRYKLQSWEIYMEEQTTITSQETVFEPLPDAR